MKIRLPYLFAIMFLAAAMLPARALPQAQPSSSEPQELRKLVEAMSAQMSKMQASDGVVQLVAKVAVAIGSQQMDKERARGECANDCRIARRPGGCLDDDRENGGLKREIVRSNLRL